MPAEGGWRCRFAVFFRRRIRRAAGQELDSGDGEVLRDHGGDLWQGEPTYLPL